MIAPAAMRRRGHANPSRRLLTAAAVAAIAFALYHATLLPGVDFGDTGSFQATVGERVISPRDGYPLYFAIGDLFLRLTRAEPAHALNLASAVEGAVACGLLVPVAAELAGSLAAGAAAALLFAVSYTFWTQAIIAEVYALHAIFVALTLWLLLRWEARPTLARLTIFFAVYALGFGNHLSMVLLLPGYTLFLLLAAPGGWRSMLAPRVVLVAIACAAAGALQYAWNLRELWLWPNHTRGLADALQIFWFDVTKTDWRETMVLRVPGSMLTDRLAMYLFDVREQFGWAVWLAPLGLIRLFARTWRRGVLMLVLFAVNFAFAFTYNVGDTHVFYLPSHLILALLAAAGIAFVGDALGTLGRRGTDGASARAVGVTLAAAALVAYAGARMYRDFPAVDRSDDRRPEQLLSALTAGLDDRHAILLIDLNWQIQNGLSYFGKVTRPSVAYERAPDVLLYAPTLIADNRAVQREVTLTARARADLETAYGPLVPAAPDPRAPVTSISEMVRDLPAGTRFVLCALKPTRDYTIDIADLAAALRTLTGNRVTAMPAGDYAAVAGRVGAAPALSAAADDPFTRTARLDGVDVVVRMESWLPDDTIRRMGFAQVVAAHHHTLIVERGISFAAFDPQGRAIRVAYAAGIFAPQTRYLVTGR